MIALIMAMTDIYLVNSLYTHRSLIMFYSDLERRATLHFLFMDRKNNPTTEEFSTPFQIFATTLTLFQVLILIPSVVLVPYLDLFVLLVPLCVRRIMREFRQFCKNSVGSPYASERGIEFYCWISSPENSDAISSKTISSLLVDFHSNQIALKGNGFFVITYRFLGTIFGVIVTYAIITIQLQITRRENGYHRPKNEFTMHECICSSNSSSGAT
ncbi:unnamed protein product [Orchesella dallaii]|uniref:Uncharacterized protein n=1 Tax=Orchesella dallaii TaxID=48710 RepID=A0ABP1RCZ6_9HEXA